MGRTETEGETVGERPAVDGTGVAGDLEVARTELGDLMRLDVANLGGPIPPHLTATPDDGPPGRVASPGAAQSWAAEQNTALCDALTQIAGTAGGGFDSFAEWTVLYAPGCYDGAGMRDSRLARFTPGYRAAITTLSALDPARGTAVRIAGEAYVARRPGALSLRCWQPAALYTTEHMALAPAVVVDLGDARWVYFSGLVAWDRAHQPLLADAPRRQVRYVLDLLEACLVELGGSRANVVRLRPFTHAGGTAEIVRRELAAFWCHDSPPAVCLFDGTSFGQTPRLHLELQAFAILPAAGRVAAPPAPVASRHPELAVCTPAAGGARLAAIGELRPEPGATSVETAAGSLADRLLEAVALAGLRPTDLRRVFVYAVTDPAAAALRRRLRHVSGAAVHVVPCPPFPDLRGDLLRAEAVAIADRRPGRPGEP